MPGGGKYISVEGLDVAKESSSDLEELADMFDSGKLEATIDKTFDIDDVVEASRYVDSGRKKGSVVLLVSKNKMKELK